MDAGPDSWQAENLGIIRLQTTLEHVPDEVKRKTLQENLMTASAIAERVWCKLDTSVRVYLRRTSTVQRYVTSYRQNSRRKQCSCLIVWSSVSAVCCSIDQRPRNECWC
jgi:hypothetical protein